MLTFFKSSDRSGTSLVELIGILLAVTAGLCIGAKYVGLDFNRVVYVAMDETEVLTKLPEEWRPVNPDCPNGDCASPEEIRSAKADSLRHGLAMLHREVARMKGEELPEEELQKIAHSESESLIQKHTAEYWKSLLSILAEVEQLEQRMDSMEDSSSRLMVRKELFDYAHKAIRNLDTEQVDPKVLAAGVRLTEWYQAGADLHLKTIVIHRKSAAGEPALREIKDYSVAETQHKMQTELVQRWVSETERYLQTHYGSDYAGSSL